MLRMRRVLLISQVAQHGRVVLIEASELEPFVAAGGEVFEYFTLPRIVPKHVTNFCSTTSRSAAHRNHVYA